MAMCCFVQHNRVVSDDIRWQRKVTEGQATHLQGSWPLIAAEQMNHHPQCSATLTNMRLVVRSCVINTGINNWNH